VGTRLGASAPLQPPPSLGVASQRLLGRYRNCGPLLLGRARNALISRPLDGRDACDLRGGCLWGCPLGAIYDARSDLARLAMHRNFRIEERAEVASLAKQGDVWQARTSDGRVFSASRIMLAAGTLGSTRLVASMLPPISEWRLLNNPVMAMPLLMPGAFAAAPRSSHDLAQLAFFLRFAEGAGDYVSGAIYETQGLPASSFASQLPLGRRTGEALFRFLSPALIVAVTYFPGGFSENRLRFEPSTRRLTVIGGFRAGFPDLARRVSGSWHATGVRWARYPWQGASWRCLGQTLISLEPCPWEAGAPTAPMF
jgi:hypothetical protein